MIIRSAAVKRALVALIVLVASATAATSAIAHSVLKDTAPRRNERVTTPVTVIRMTFNETVSAPRIVARDSRQRRITGSQSTNGSIVEFRPTRAITGGNVTVTWQVRSRDGHSISGKWNFTVSPVTRTTTPERTP